MKFHFANTELSYAPMMRGEIEYWLFKGETIFKHRGDYWMRLYSERGHRIMIAVHPGQLAQVNPRLYTNDHGIIRSTRTYKAKQ